MIQHAGRDPRYARVMRRRHIVAAIGAIACAIAVACLPEYTFGGGGVRDGGSQDGSSPEGATDGTVGDDGATDAAPPPFDAHATARLDPVTDGGTFRFRIDVEEDRDVLMSGALSYSFAIDLREVTVGRFRAWADSGGRRPPEAGTSLDPGGPYVTTMQWAGDWTGALSNSYDNCDHGPLDYGSPATYGRNNDSLPMTCVSWFDALAFCAWEGKRLPTELEWQFAATSRGANMTFPWTNESDFAPLDCDHVTFNMDGGALDGGGCRFPRYAGAAALGASSEGVLDLSGSVFEWVWDVGAPFPDAGVPANFAASTTDAGTSAPRVRRGGSFNTGPDERKLRNWGRAWEFGGDTRFDDLGFRCAQTLP